MEATVAERGQITGGLLDGPLAFDNAISLEAARTKKIVSPVAGRANVLIVPDLLSTYSDDPKILRLGAVISESGKRGHEMADSMLSFVRGSRKASETISVAALFSAVQLLLQGSLSRQVRLVVEPPPEDLLIEGNYTEFQQCLINLCLNGIQAMAEHLVEKLDQPALQAGELSRKTEDGGAS